MQPRSGNRPHRSRSAICALVLILFFLGSSCRKAEGVQEDPLALAAEEALVAYIRIDTSNPPGNETAGAAFLRDLLQKEGIATQLIGKDPRRQALYARLESQSSEKALLLLSHIDVVPAKAAQWTNPPFSGAREGGYIWGRGTLDIKSLTIAQAYALIDLKRSGAKLKRDVVLLAVPDEELGGLAGAARLLDEHGNLFADVGFVLNEGGSNETAVDKVIFWGIEVQQKVPLWLRLTAAASGGHGAGGHGAGASARLVRALARVEAIETPYRLSEPVGRLLAIAARTRRDGRGRKLAALREPLDPKFIESELPPGYRSLLRDTVAITYLDAGSAINAVPSRAEAGLDVRLLPDSDVESMLQRVRAAAGPDAEVEVVLRGTAAPESSHQTELFAVLTRVMTSAEAGSTVAPTVGSGTTDSRFFRARGIVAYGIAPFKVNYYDADSVHAENERIRSRFFRDGVRVMRAVVREFCVQ